MKRAQIKIWTLGYGVVNLYEKEPNDTSSDSSVDDPPSLTVDPVSVEGIKKVSFLFC